MPRILLDITSDPQTYVQLLVDVGRHNKRWLERNPNAPLLYDSGAIYRPDPPGPDLWLDASGILSEGGDDCDGLASMRMGELLARGARAIGPGDAGYKLGLRMRSIPAQVFLTTRARPGQSGTSHAVVRYKIGGRWYEDDPSARLGMRRGRIDPWVVRRWERHGISIASVNRRWASRGLTFVEAK